VSVSVELLGVVREVAAEVPPKWSAGGGEVASGG